MVLPPWPLEQQKEERGGPMLQRRLTKQVEMKARKQPEEEFLLKYE
jgi:hypothetical protein